MSSYDVIVVGGGPAGSTVACLLARRGINTLLLEEKRMPREKLCGAFITPESFPTLDRLGVLDRVLGAGAQRISEIRLVAPSGRFVTTEIPAILRQANWGLSLSRSRLDAILFDRAKESGAICLEGIAVKRVAFKGDRPRAVECLALPGGEARVFEAPLVIDASGRNSRLSVPAADRMAGKKGNRLYALKAHLQNVEVVPERVELYFFQTGYGGLSLIEGGLVNLCFITTERSIKDADGDAARVAEQTIMRNPAAHEKLKNARVVGRWLSAGPLSFGHKRLFRDGLMAVGDATGMIDPFTGTGIQVALRSGELLAGCILDAVGQPNERQVPGESETISRVGGPLTGAMAEIAGQVCTLYAARFKAEFGSRMAVAGALRFVAFSPRVVRLVASLFGCSTGLFNKAVAATRLGSGPVKVPPAQARQIMELSPPDGVSTD